ncbi:minichromosome maintenance protein [Ordospora colligata]|uniref:DNA replication licensing factor MCM3 n=1 Tax=Ordospora colligata OC4 TaxID=1354746 RepID=A0A0B2UJE1_9MICR|nr:minichromosome maintenance protein [Ordospora colligata OC4]KHN69100.1 minichromosome maintenance protein [Ordospora colligata OC4]TBU14555.1 minichromosome maintenance protein [Ordospora colligata]TBU14749.1 minichromosome maintenance protein [Ordospora colligata]TBU18183.1 minichromosome maintenance protein [Ordospora colligata]
MESNCIEAFKSFIEEYRTGMGKDIAEVIAKMAHEAEQRVLLSMNEIRVFDKSLAKGIIEDPMSLVPFIEDELSMIGGRKMFVGVYGSFGDYSVNPRTLSSAYLGRMICLEGIVTSCSICRPKVMKSVHYSTANNLFYSKDYRDSTMITKLPITNTVYPTRDPEGGLLTTEFGLSEYFDYQTVVLQEMPEKAPPGQLPRSVEVVLSFDLVDKVKPGDRVNIYGIYKSLCFGGQGFPLKFKTVLIANNIERIGRKVEEYVDEAVFMRLSVVTDLHKLVAPSIFGHDAIKRSIALLLVGGNEIVMKNGSKIRGDINILLVGDPSTAKSQLLRYVMNAARLSVATTGKGSSGVGLTAAVVQDKDTGDRRLEAGAMVLADRGVVCIDEFDKMNDGDRVAIHEVMEQQTVTIAKAGIHTTLNARCSVLAAANPMWGQYRENKSPQENVRLPESLLTRFDLIFVTLDKSNTDIDQMISSHVLRMHMLENGYDEPSGISQDVFRAYIQYCKQKRPVLSREAAGLIIKEYTLLRQSKDRKEQVVSITPRLLETMIRLATANAKLRLSDVVEYSDAECVISLIKDSLFQKLIKPGKKVKIIGIEENENDEFAMDSAGSGLKQDLEAVMLSEEKAEYISNALYEYSVNPNNPRVFDIDEFVGRLGTGVTLQEVEKVLEDLAAKDLILFENGRIYLIN